MSERACSKAGCSHSAVATLSYDYNQSIAVLGPKSPKPEPGCFDLCSQHSSSFSPPQGWQVIRHQFVAATNSKDPK
jgi:Protein of unknown function (DUF3499)